MTEDEAAELRSLRGSIDNIDAALVHLEENVAADAVRLTPEQVALLDATGATDGA